MPANSQSAPGTDPWADPTARPRFQTVAEVAAMMRVSKMTVYRLVHSGELPAVRTGRTLRLPLAAVRRHLQSTRTTTVAGRSGGVPSRDDEAAGQDAGDSGARAER